MKLELALFGIAAVGGIALASGAASAMPNGLTHSISSISKIGEVRHVCNVWDRAGGDRTVSAQMPSIEAPASTPVRTSMAAGTTLPRRRA